MRSGRTLAGPGEWAVCLLSLALVSPTSSSLGLFICLVVFFYQLVYILKRDCSLFIPLPLDILYSYFKGLVLPVIMPSCTQRPVNYREGHGRAATETSRLALGGMLYLLDSLGSGDSSSLPPPWPFLPEAVTPTSAFPCTWPECLSQVPPRSLPMVFALTLHKHGQAISCPLFCDRSHDLQNFRSRAFILRVCLPLKINHLAVN